MLSGYDMTLLIVLGLIILFILVNGSRDNFALCTNVKNDSHKLTGSAW
jgi:hypothetical protein